MHRDEQNVPFLLELQRFRSEQRPMRQVESGLRFLLGESADLFFPLFRSPLTQIDDFESSRLPRLDNLRRLAFGRSDA